MSARDVLGRAVVEAIERYGDKTFEFRAILADEVAHELLGAAKARSQEEVATMALGLRGIGVWMREFGDATPEEAAAALDFVVVAGHTRNGRANRSAEALAWIARFRELGGKVWVYDWLPTPAMGAAHLPELVAWAKSIGALGVMADLEPDAGWRTAVGPATVYAQTLAQLTRAADLKSGYTDYGRGGNSDAVMRAVLAEVDVGVPQSYDPDGTDLGDEAYHERSVAYWRERGAKCVVLGYGVWLRNAHRHRTDLELQQHLGGISRIPAGICGAIGWYASPGLRPRLATLKALRPPAARRSLLDLLTPFGAALRDEMDCC